VRTRFDGKDIAPEPGPRSKPLDEVGQQMRRSRRQRTVQRAADEAGVRGSCPLDDEWEGWPVAEASRNASPTDELAGRSLSSRPQNGSSYCECTVNLVQRRNGERGDFARSRYE